ncbi:MAG: hypothetical protein U0R26_11365 [Solirubrobacterales bacterium]
MTGAIRARNHKLAVRLRRLIIDHGLWPEETPPMAADLLVELGDRVLELAFRNPGPPERERSSSAAPALAAAAALGRAPVLGGTGETP